MPHVRFSAYLFFCVLLIGIPLFLFQFRATGNHIPVVQAAFVRPAPSSFTDHPSKDPSVASFSYAIGENAITASPSPSPFSSISQTPHSGVDSFLLQEVNNFRKANGLSEVQTNDATCSFARLRASEIASGFNHDGFTNRIAGKQLPYSSYTNITENIAENSDYKAVVNDWANSPGHAANMKADTPFVCVAQNGNYFAYEGLRP